MSLQPDLNPSDSQQVKQNSREFSPVETYILGKAAAGIVISNGTIQYNGMSSGLELTNATVIEAIRNLYEAGFLKTVQFGAKPDYEFGCFSLVRNSLSDLSVATFRNSI